MTPQEREIFFALIRSAIWEQPVDYTIFDSPDWIWKNILRNLHHQQLIGFVAPVVFSLPDQYLPDQQSVQYIKSIVASLTKTHFEINKAIADIFTLLEQSGCTPVLLKGQGLASLYPNPNLRSCGDIDIYVGEEDYIKSCHIIDSYCGYTTQKIQIDDQNHYPARRKGKAIFEVHHTSGNTVLKKQQAAYRRWERGELISNNCDTILLCGKKIPIPSLSFNCTYLINHFLSHQKDFGIGLRQLVDYAFVLRNSGDQEMSAITSFGFLRPYQILSGILHYQLGMPEECIPYFNPQLANLSQGVVLDTILDNGNFGSSNKLNHNYYSYGPTRWYYILRNKFYQLRSTYVLVPKLAIRESICFIPTAIFSFIKHYFNRISTYFTDKSINNQNNG